MIAMVEAPLLQFNFAKMLHQTKNGYNAKYLVVPQYSIPASFSSATLYTHPENWVYQTLDMTQTQMFH